MREIIGNLAGPISGMFSPTKMLTRLEKNFGWRFGVEFPEFKKLLFLACFYTSAIVGAHGLAFLIRFEFHLSSAQLRELWDSILWMLPIELLCLLGFGQFHCLLSYFSLPDLKRIIAANLTLAFLSTGIWYASAGQNAPPRSLILLNFILDTITLVAGRLLFRVIRERRHTDGEVDGGVRRILIIGAGDVGANLAKEMMSRPDLKMRPVAFLDDDPAKWRTSIHGVPVSGRPELLLDGRIGADEAVIAMPSANGRRVREVVQVFQKLGLKSEIVPSLEQMINGAVRVSQLRPVQIEDLLGRERVSLETERIRALVEGKIIMVTGAGGSIGSELCRQIVRCNPRRLLLVEQSEPSLFLIEQELIDAKMGAFIQPLVADILDTVRMNTLFSTHAPQVIFHAAAHKHVSLMERQPSEAIKNNAVGTRKLAEIAVAHDAEVFVLISTDKAINPTNVMGASKRLAELHLQAMHAAIMAEYSLARERHHSVLTALSGNTSSVPFGGPKELEVSLDTSEEIAERDAIRAGCDRARRPRTKLISVRFGNVLGSSGSVIPIFRRQIASGGPVTVTHPEVIRYFMTIPEAAGLVMQASVLGEGGEIFVLDMGQPMKIVDLAKNMIELSGYKVGDDIEIRFTGLKPGEKLFEELRHQDESHQPTNHPQVMRFVNSGNPSRSSRMAIEKLEPFLDKLSSNDLKRGLKTIIPEYEPCFE